jgi:16S rRNA (adenine1518-N6/adenine1519-N6)-dimethyltransferase
MDAWMLNYDSPTSIREFLDSRGLWATKRFGQNFLIDRSVRERIVGALELEASMNVWEIGPGIGAMTKLILEKGEQLTAFEIDFGLFAC